MKNKLVIGLGSNLGNRYAYIYQAFLQIGQKVGSTGVLSSIYQTPPWGETHQPQFLNAVAVFETELGLEHCFEQLKNIEKNLGRKYIKRWGPRCIDLDILFYNTDIFRSELLEVPHKSIVERAFVLVPVAELLPDFIHPILKTSMVELLQNIENDCEVFE
jgi:2-amino-4-hydroxy-6-hydroxymethyldihydropteridine diphosphokinase